MKYFIELESPEELETTSKIRQEISMGIGCGFKLKDIIVELRNGKISPRDKAKFNQIKNNYFLYN